MLERVLPNTPKPLSAANPLPTDDINLWKSAAGGDQDARQALIQRAWTASATRLGRFPAADQDDLRQEIAASLIRALDTGMAPTSNLDGFLHWRGRGEISKFIKQRIKTRQFTQVSEALHAADVADSPFARASADELRSAIEECSDRIENRDHRTSWRARFLDGLEPKQIATQRGVAAEVVRSWISRASKRVRTCLENTLGEETRR